MVTAYAILKKGAANANHAGGRLNDPAYRLIVQVCDEILAGQHHDMFRVGGRNRIMRDVRPPANEIWRGASES